MNEISNKTVPVETETYNRVTKALQIGRNGVRLEEWELARFFWQEVLREIDWSTVPPMALILAEEALTLRMLAVRLLNQIHERTLMVERRTGPDVLNPTVEHWARTQEKLRKVMKELLGAYGPRKDDPLPKSLAEMMRPILKQGEEILNGLQSFEYCEETIEEEYWEEVIDD